jgi:alkylation response protein AidB-like acyl-CoA dehydrogenase
MYRLNAEQTALIEQVRKVATEQIGPNAAEADEKSRFPRPSIDALARAGFLGLTVPAEYGGKGQGMRTACAALDELAQVCASTGMVYLMHLCGTACYVSYPNGKEELLKQVARGEHLSTLAFSEKGSRSHFWAPVSRAAQNNGHIVINALKSFVTSAGEADGYVVSTGAVGATEPTESSLYLVLKNDRGVSVSGAWNSLGMRGNASSPVTLANCAIPADRALSEPGKGFQSMLETLPWFNLGSAAISVGIAEATTNATAGHLTGSNLEHLGSRLADLPNLRARLAQMRIETDRARAHLVAAIDAIENGAPTATLLMLESKAAAAESAMRVTDIGMQACGGAAFSKHLGIERNFRDSRAASVMAPTSDVLHEFIGRALCGMELF